MKHIRNIVFGSLALLAASCVNDLDRVPFIEVTSATVYNDPASYRQILAKCYAGLSLSGQQGPAGRPDISGIDEGFSTYLRQYWKAQELTTDEAVIGWNDGSLQDYQKMNWTSGNEFVTAMYNRIFYQITLCNEFIRETTPDKLASRGITDAQIPVYRAEARFLRALSYWHAMDMFGTVPFVTEDDAPGAFLPNQISRADLFAYVESELKAIENELKAPGTQEYGRADQAAAWTLLAKVYLNAEVYINTPKYTEAIAYAANVISSTYTLDTKFETPFLADNRISREIIFPIVFDGTHAKTYGGMTFLVHAAVGGNMRPADFGINGGWAGIRTTKNIAALFEDLTGATDSRAQFHTDGQTLEINDIGNFNDGYAITKFRNITSTGEPGSDRTGDFVDTDFPMFRLADVYLMYAEAVLRGGTGGSNAEALQYFNALRQRAYGNSSGNVTSLNLNLILDERARELCWEGHRRTDLIRYNRLTGAVYLWPWKGDVKDGVGVDERFNLFPIPSADLVANPNLVKNHPAY